MIVRDGAATLPACLQSVAALCDESIVVDTGSEDDSVEIARSFGARVIRTPWEHDFSAARNVYLQHARGSWVLSLDADEVLGPLSRQTLGAALSNHPATAFLFRVRNYFSNGHAPEPALPSRLHDSYMLSRTIRLFPRVPGLRYAYPVHESLLPAIRRLGLRVRESAIPIHHTGYLDTGGAGCAKVMLYRSLGEKKISVFPRHALGYVELGKVCLHEGELNEAARLFARAIGLAPRSVEAHYFLAVTLHRLGRHTECRRLVNRASRRFPLNRDIRSLEQVCDRHAG